MKDSKWIEKTLDQSLGRIVDCILDYARSNITDKDYSRSYRPISHVFEFGEQGTLVSYPGELEPYNHLDLKYKKAEEIVKIITEKSLTSEFEKISLEARNGDEIDFNFFNFVRRILRKGANSREVIHIAIDDILERPINWTMRAYVFGLKIEEKSLHIDKLTFRHPDGEDFIADFIDWSMYDDFDYIPSTTRWEPVHTIIEWKTDKIKKSKNITLNLQKEATQLIQDLRLVKTSRFLLTQWAATAESAIIDPIVYRESLRKSVANAESIPSVVFDSNDSEKHAHLLENVFRKKLSEVNLSDRISRGRNMYELACERESVESILFSVIGLETLYSDGNQELKFKLASRIATLLGKVTGESERIYESVSAAYDIRSKFVHGSPLKKYEDDEIETIVETLRELLRVSIIVWSSGNFKKKETAVGIRQKIDIMLYSEKVSKEIDSFLENVSV